MLKPENYPNYVFGGDSSRWQDRDDTNAHPDFQKAYDNGWKFNFLKASQGLWVDKYYKTHLELCKKTPMLLGAYHFLEWAEPEKQADFFWNTVKNDGLVLPLVVDFEWYSTIPSNAFDILYRFLERMKKIAPGKKLMIYTAKGFWDQYGKKDTYWKQYLIWLARYMDTPPVGTSGVPLPWEKADFWQFTGNGDGFYYGMESAGTDLDFAMMTWQELLGLCKLDNTIPEDPGTSQGDIMDYTQNSLGVYTETTNFSNIFDFVVAYCGKSGNGNETVPQSFSDIVQKAYDTKVPVFAYYKFEVDYYVNQAYPMDETKWPPYSQDFPLQTLTKALKGRVVHGVIVEIMDATANGKTQPSNFVSFAADQFVKNLKTWIIANKPSLTNQIYVASSYPFISAYAPNMAISGWVDHYENMVVVKTTGLVQNAYPSGNDKPGYLCNKAWKLWKFWDNLAIYNGNKSKLYSDLGYTNSGSVVVPDTSGSGTQNTGGGVSIEDFNALSGSLSALQSRVLHLENILSGIKNEINK